jgi:hypothetical protein
MVTTNSDTGAAGQPDHHVLLATSATVHWGYFSRSLKPVLSVRSGDFVTIEALTHHAYDDYARMIEGDPGAESVFHWTKDAKNVDRRVPDRWRLDPWARRRRRVRRPYLHRSRLYTRCRAG